MADAHNLTVVTYNLHGFNQGVFLLTSLCGNVDVIFVQEHWLAPFDLHRLYNFCDDYICFASSAMDEVISSSCLHGRPFGGVAILVKKSLGSSSKLVKASSRYIIVKIGDVLFINVHLPCVSTPNCSDVVFDCLSSILNDIGDVHYSHIIFGGDLNVAIARDNDNDLCVVLHDFASNLDMKFLHDKLPSDNRMTYRVVTTGASASIDHFAVCQSLYNSVHSITVEDSGINLSDHCPVILNIDTPGFNTLPSNVKGGTEPREQLIYRWDVGDTTLYYSLTGNSLNGIEAPIHLLSDSNVGSDTLAAVNLYCDNIVRSLREAAYTSIPRKKRSHFKY